MFAFGESITVTTPGDVVPGEFDVAGNPLVSAPTTRTVSDVGVAPLTPQESAELFGDMSIGGFTLYLPHGADLGAADTVTVRGTSGYQVEGDAGAVEWRSPFTGWNPGQVAVVRRAS